MSGGDSGLRSFHEVYRFSLEEPVPYYGEDRLCCGIYYFILPAIHRPHILLKNAKAIIWDNISAVGVSARFQVLVQSALHILRCLSCPMPVGDVEARYFQFRYHP